MTLYVSHVSKRYPSPRGAVTALQEITFTAAAGEFIALVGPSGCGKSTLLRLVAGLLAPDSGNIAFAGWPHPPKRRLVFQEHSLFPWLTVLDNVAFGLEMDGVPRINWRSWALPTSCATIPTSFPVACGSERQLRAPWSHSRISC